MLKACTATVAVGSLCRLKSHYPTHGDVATRHLHPAFTSLTTAFAASIALDDLLTGTTHLFLSRYPVIRRGGITTLILQQDKDPRMAHCRSSIKAVS
jgi:hypothetical protein